MVSQSVISKLKTVLKPKVYRMFQNCVFSQFEHKVALPTHIVNFLTKDNWLNMDGIVPEVEYHSLF